jgi:hypothetical protein
LSDDRPKPRGASSPRLGEHRGAFLLSAAELAAHCNHGDVIATHHGRPSAVLHLDADGQRLVTRIWRRKGLFTSDRLWPYAERFRHALTALAAVDVPVPRYRAHGRVRGAGERVVVCEWLEGDTLRSLGGRFDRKALATFVAELHERGIHVRGLNLGDVVRLPDGRLGLLDVQAVELRNRPLPLRVRERNLAMLCSRDEDLAFMTAHWSELVMAYCRAANLTLAQAAHLRERVRVRIEGRRARRAGRPPAFTLEPAGYPAGAPALQQLPRTGLRPR